MRMSTSSCYSDITQMRVHRSCFCIFVWTDIARYFSKMQERVQTFVNFHFISYFQWFSTYKIVFLYIRDKLLEKKLPNVPKRFNAYMVLLEDPWCYNQGPIPGWCPQCPGLQVPSMNENKTKKRVNSGLVSKGIIIKTKLSLTSWWLLMSQTESRNNFISSWEIVWFQSCCSCWSLSFICLWESPPDTNLSKTTSH